MNIDQILDTIFILPEAAKSKIKEHIIEGNYRKGSILLKAGRIEKSLYFIKKGIVRAYTNNPESEVTFWFGKEGDTILSMRSYVENGKAYEDIELLEDCILYELNTEHLQQLFTEDLQIANWGRKLAEQELIKTEERLISRQVKSASQRYEDLLRDFPFLIERVQLSLIASYLGITQVSLSRIRSGLK